MLLKQKLATVHGTVYSDIEVSIPRKGLVLLKHEPDPALESEFRFNP